MSKHLRLQTLYRGCKISYDPLHYNLKDRLFETKYNLLGIYANMFDNKALYLMEDSIEKHFVATRKAGKKATKHLPMSTIYKETLCQKTWKDGHNTSTYVSDSTEETAYHNILTYTNDLYVNFGAFYELTGSPFNELQSFEKGLIYLVIAMQNEKSIMKELGWLFTPLYKEPYENLIGMVPYKDILNLEDENNLWIFCEDVHNSFWLMSWENTTPELVQRYVAQTIEILYLLNTIPDDYAILAVEGCLNYRLNAFTERWLFKFVGTDISINSNVKDIIALTDKKQRFNAIREYIMNETFMDDCETPASNSMNFLLRTLNSFAQKISMQYITVSKTVLLYNFGKANKIFKKEDLENVAAATGVGIGGALAAGEVDLADWVPDEFKTSVKSDLESSLAPDPTDKSKAIMGTLEALDLLSANYKENRYSFTTNTVPYSETHKTSYDTIAESIYKVNKELIKDIKEIKTYNTGGKEGEKSRGRLDRKNMYSYKTNKNIFYENTYKTKESDLVFGIVLDVSGSMRGKGIDNGITTMILLHETLRTIGINHSIITHTSSSDMNSEIKTYVHFRESKQYDMRRAYSLMSIKATGGNCDSGALYYMEKGLLRTKNKDKICIIFSDGQPTECSGTDLKMQVASMENKGIKVIGVGINFAEIKEYYSDYANGKNIPDMLRIVSGILKRYVLEKKD